MFGGGSTNPYDEVVTKTTDENLTSENWELILNLCDKVQEEGQEGCVICRLAVSPLTRHSKGSQCHSCCAQEVGSS
ncbi:uncharacterized protein EV420DRAFT_195887 [Desarmillaria tabescens]|uniref:VHS domain-containing protein n=1 Tax=Armillaria tabescens TaxID=1929756 RepID=A0AA39N998_ARMTA|nr:uncharacterized protein EV420DRAFT_195887 [Desarmillaria tabescens]KAK0461373.1 hypothetical protein EV420DRAFT_195887 [Desarmillaria tabescens]